LIVGGRTTTHLLNASRSFVLVVEFWAFIAEPRKDGDTENAANVHVLLGARLKGCFLLFRVSAPQRFRDKLHGSITEDEDEDDNEPDLLVFLSGQAAYFRKGDDVSQQTDRQQPKTASDSQQNAPAQNESDQQIGKDRTKEFHGESLPRRRPLSSFGRA
jgi:hypothetical protein